MTVPRGSGRLIRVTDAEYRALIAASVSHDSYLMDDDGTPYYAEARRESKALTRLIHKVQAAQPTPKENRHADHP